ncbi:MAG: hypothetical protein ACXWAC_09650 [Usitatibacter sp.]
MKQRIPMLLAAAVLFTQPALAADDAAVKKDLTAVIALQGKPCGEVTEVERKGDNDYVATCKDGNRYRVYTKDGRVIVEKQ